MWWEVYVNNYLFSEDTYTIEGISDPIFVKEFKVFSEALETFENLVHHSHNKYARVFIKVFDGEHPEGDLMCVYSLEWDDEIFNNNAV